MRLSFDPRAQRLLRTMPRASGFGLVELALLALLAIQCARLMWTAVTPVGPVGDWRAAPPAAPAATGLAEFDPFFRLAPAAGPVAVTALDLKLFGVREDRASGRGSAIVGTPDGQQKSFAVGEEIMPGVTLKAVEFDSVTISRGGADEQLFMDQSGAAPAGDPSGAPGAPPGPPPAPPPSVNVAPPPPVVAPPPVSRGDPSADIRFSPRMNGSEVTGVEVFPRGGGEAFRAAGLAPGDVVLAVNGRRIRSAADAQAVAGQLSGARAPAIQVERGGRVVTLRGGN